LASLSSAQAAAMASSPWPAAPSRAASSRVERAAIMRDTRTQLRARRPGGGLPAPLLLGALPALLGWLLAGLGWLLRGRCC
jgi:hypothetical protein